MATYAELLSISENSTLKNKIRVAVIVAAEAVRTEVNTTPNHANRLIWAKSVFQHPNGEADRMLWAVLAQNKDLTTAQITSATDAQVQTAVNNAVDVFAT